MSQPPEFWTFVSVNVFVALLGGGLTATSYLAYRREGDPSFWVAAVGFALVSLGSMLAFIYQIFVTHTYSLGGLELLRLQTLQGALGATGLLILVYSVYRY